MCCLPNTRFMFVCRVLQLELLTYGNIALDWSTSCTAFIYKVMYSESIDWLVVTVRTWGEFKTGSVIVLNRIYRLLSCPKYVVCLQVLWITLNDEYTYSKLILWSLPMGLSMAFPPAQELYKIIYILFLCR